jgi:hypothetical integral membrane protein (TIGR02206 family)
MKRAVWIYLSILGLTDLGLCVALARPELVRVHNPVSGYAYPRSLAVEGDAWSASGITRIEVVADGTGGGGSAAVEATRAAVRSPGRPARPLAAFSAGLQLPADGEWSVRARAYLRDGRVIESRAARITASAGTPSRAFVHFGGQHLVALLVVAAACVALGLYFKPPRPDAHKNAAALAIAAVLWANEYAYHWYWFALGAYAVTNNLMLHMCGLAILVIPPLFTLAPGRPRQVLFEVIYFWGLGGAVQALLAPDIGQHGFPEFKTFAFFVSHGLICASAVYMIAARKMTLTIGSLGRALLVSNAAMVVVYFVNLAIAVVPPHEIANYFMIGYPPPTGSIIDLFAEVFGPSPRYIIGLEGMAVALFTLMYLPFPIARVLRRCGRARNPAEDAAGESAG